uniref:Sex-regulated protein janus-A n=1 Tax=Elaeophora elaphi TaxID=1147741 RepID=A0A0R3RXP7_9BILA
MDVRTTVAFYQTSSRISRFIRTVTQFRRVKLFSSTVRMPLVDVPSAKIDPDGVFKYILIKVIEKASMKEKLIVRGYARCAFHGDVLDETEKELGSDYELSCLGGGRIKHEPKDRTILVYGYSQGYGPADHQKSVDILKEKYPDYKISFMLFWILIVPNFLHSMSLENIPDVNIDPEGIFKYIMIKVPVKIISAVTSEPKGGEKLIIRGYKHCKWHKNIFKQTEKEIGTSFSLKCVGGGRINHEPQKKSLFVYGYSQRYGPAKHEQTVELLQKKYPEYKITYSYEGY